MNYNSLAKQDGKWTMLSDLDLVEPITLGVHLLQIGVLHNDTKSLAIADKPPTLLPSGE